MAGSHRSRLSFDGSALSGDRSPGGRTVGQPRRGSTRPLGRRIPVVGPSVGRRRPPRTGDRGQGRPGEPGRDRGYVLPGAPTAVVATTRHSSALGCVSALEHRGLSLLTPPHPAAPRPRSRPVGPRGGLARPLPVRGPGGVRARRSCADGHLPFRRGDARRVRRRRPGWAGGPRRGGGRVPVPAPGRPDVGAAPPRHPRRIGHRVRRPGATWCRPGCSGSTCRSNSTGSVGWLLIDGWLVIEADGFEDYSTRTAYRNDRRRGVAGVVGGWVTLRFGYEDITRRSAAVTTAVLATLARHRRGVFRTAAPT